MMIRRMLVLLIAVVCLWALAGDVVAQCGWLRLLGYWPALSQPR